MSRNAEAGVLAVARDGTPTVGYVETGGLVVSTRVAGRWRPVRLALPAPTGEPAVVAAAVDRNGRAAVLVQDNFRRTIAVAWRRQARWRVIVIARVRTEAQLGTAGLTLDSRGRPVVAYAFRRPSGKTYLRVARVDRRERVATTPITQLGFPDSALPPSAAPHLTRGGLVRVVEAFTSAVIDWFRDGRKWTGQFLFASRLGSPIGRVLVAQGRRGPIVAWSQDYPSFGERHVLLQQGPPTGQVADVLPHAHLSALTVAGGAPEVAGNDWVDVDGWTTFAGLLAYPSQAPVELDGRIDGYAAVPRGRELLVATTNGLEWFRVPRPSIRVSLTVDAAGNARGRVDGAAGGTVDIYRDAPDTGRRLEASAPLAPDGSFAATVPAAATLYRAVYRDPATGVAYGALLRRPAGS